MVSIPLKFNIKLFFIICLVLCLSFSDCKVPKKFLPDEDIVNKSGLRSRRTSINHLPPYIQPVIRSNESKVVNFITHKNNILNNKDPKISASSFSIRKLYNENETTSTQSSMKEQRKRRGLGENRESVTEEDNGDITWPLRRVAEVDGDITLGGLMMVHEREDERTCGPIMPQGGIQALETMLFTIDFINKKMLDFLPGFKLGAFIHDDCDKDSYGLELAVDFIKGSLSNIHDGDYRCAKEQSPEATRNNVISGVVGAASSVTSIQVANLLRLFKIPQVSFFSTSPELSNKQRFEYFSRTIPSDHHQVMAMTKLVTLLKWSYVSIIYEESNYGVKAFEELEVLLDEHDVCIAVKEKLVKDSGVADESAYDNIVKKLLQKEMAKGVIIFGSDQEVAGVMRAVRRNNATGIFSWIGSDGWSARSLVSSGNEAEVEGTLSVQPQANRVKGFLRYFLELTPENNKRNPWFSEYWEDHFKCRYRGSVRTPFNEKYKKPCRNSFRLKKNETEIEAQLQFVSDAVMAFAYALRGLHADVCRGKRGLCNEMRPIHGEQLLSQLRNVSFRGLTGDQFKFDEYGDGPARYNIIHFKQLSRGEYKWVHVGTYINGKLNVNQSEIQFHLGQSLPPVSVCSLDCSKGQAKQYVEGEICCWHCYNCTKYQVVNPMDETQCVSCDWGSKPSDDLTYCRPIPEVYLQPDSWWAIGAMLFSSMGLVLTGLVMYIFLRHNDTPVVRASGRELSYVLLMGVLLSFAMTFVFILKPTNSVCGVQRFGLGFCFAVIYSALLTKTNRISRIFNAGKRTTKRPSFISPKSQIFICSIIVMLQVCVIAVWCMLKPPQAIHHYLHREDNFLVCQASINASYMIAFAYPIGLILVCTFYAWLTRKIPEGFNESKHIGITMYTTCIIWLAFVPIYFSTANNVEVRITTTCVTISLSATVALACLFVPKLYIILLHPEKNVRQSMLSSTKFSIMKNTHAVSSHRVDSGTQSEVIFPIEIPLSDKRPERYGQACNATIRSFLTIGTQTCDGSCSPSHHTCLHTDITLRKRAVPINSTFQDVPDVSL